MKEREDTFAKSINEIFDLKRIHENDKNMLRNENQAQKSLINELQTLYKQFKENTKGSKSLISNLEEQIQCSKEAIEEETKRYIEIKAKNSELEIEISHIRRTLNCGELVSKAYIEENEDLRNRLKVSILFNKDKGRIH